MQLSGLQLEVRWGLSLDANLYTLMGVNCYMDEGYTSILGPGFM